MLQLHPTLYIHTGISEDGTKPVASMMDILDKQSMQMSHTEDEWQEADP